MNSVYGRPHRNPNRWMITHVPVMPSKPGIDWLAVVCLVVLVGLAGWFGLALRMV